MSFIQSHAIRLYTRVYDWISWQKKGEDNMDKSWDRPDKFNLNKLITLEKPW